LAADERRSSPDFSHGTGDAGEGSAVRYSPFRLIRLSFDLMTGFSLLPIQIVSLAGMGIALLGLGFGGFLLLRRLLLGPESHGVFTLFAILFFFLGIQILALGLIGEYIGRIYMEVRRRPRYVIRKIHEAKNQES
jgi:undecaprenyl-phosphate 4-deoxy-4-formamido-L-arabinose transferase